MQTIKKLLIIANGQKEDKTFIKTCAKKSDFILALDGGADTALKAAVMPNLVLGDLDSISQNAKNKIGKEKLLKVARQDNTDLEKGLDFARYFKVPNITIICAQGGRLDFTLSNFSSVFNYIDKANIIFKTSTCDIFPLKKSTKFECKKGAKISLIPMGNTTGLTLKNLKYSLKNATFKIGQTAVSNIALKNNFEVSFKKGQLLVIINK
jgi:thiamine pyrophosphokinase